MSRLSRNRHDVEHADVHRWLVSYADYMTLLFALFVVLYAMAMVNEKAFETITESIGSVFQAGSEEEKNKVSGEDILPVTVIEPSVELFGNGILDVAGPELVEGEKELVNIKESQLGSDLTELDRQLELALFDIIESGYAELKIDGDWLEIELNSGILFPSGSASATNSAILILNVIYDVLAPGTNYIRVRGYTDNQAIQTEVFSSNWELSVYRATAILRILEELSINPARMAIEGYGQHDPIADNKTLDGRAKNRRVVIAISKYGFEQALAIKPPIISIKDVKNLANNSEKLTPVEQVKVIQLDNGGIRITTRKDNE